MNKFYTCLFFIISFLSISSACNLLDNSPPNIISLDKFSASCSSNGSVTLTCTGGGGTYFYELLDGPVKRILQTQNDFLGLPAGLYTYRVTGCNGLWTQDTFRIADEYSEIISCVAVNIDYENSFKCNITNNGKAIIYLAFSDTNYIRRPFCYQITTSSNPVNGFNGLPCNTITFYPPISTPSGGAASLLSSTMYHSDTIYNLSPGNYFIRVTDSCDNFLTTPLSIPLPPVYNTSRIGYNITLANGNSGCVAQPFFRILDTVTNIYFTTADNLPNAPFNLKIFTTSGLRVFNHNYYASEQPITGGGWSNNLSPSEHVPLNTPLVAVVTDRCGVIKTYNIPPYNSANNMIMSYGNSCLDPETIYVIVKNVFINVNKLVVFDAAGFVLDTIPMSDFSYYDANTGYPKTLGIFKYSPVTIGSVYKIKVYSNCGQADSVTFTVPTPGLSDQPTLASSFGYEYCTPGIYKTILKLIPVINTGISDVFLINGPSDVGPYPIGPEANNKYTFKHLTAGTYTVMVLYGCGQSLVYDVTVPVIDGNSYNYSQTYLKQLMCKGEGFDMIPQFSGYLPALFCRVFLVPGALKKHIKYLLEQDSIAAKSAGYTVLIQGNYPSFCDTLTFTTDTTDLLNGIITYMYSCIYLNPSTGATYQGSYARSLPSIILHKEENVNYGGEYVIDYLTCLSNQPLHRDTISIRGIIPITAGGSLGLYCSNNTSTIIMSPIGGISPYQFAYKNLSITGSSFSNYTTDSVFTFSSAPPGTIFRFLIVDNCGNSVTVDIPITSINANPVILNTDICFRQPNTIFTQFLPYATYSWTLNGNTIIFNNNYFNTFSNFSYLDTGLYVVNINFAANCTTFVAQKQVTGINCILPLTLVEFKATLRNQSVSLYWESANEINLNRYTVERSIDAINWTSVANVTAQSLTNNQTNYYYNLSDDEIPQNTQSLYYRLKMVDIDQSFTYSALQLVRFPNNQKLYFVNRLRYNFIEIHNQTNKQEDMQLQLFDLNGNCIQNDFIKLDGYYLWQIHNSIPRSIYILKYTINGESNSIKMTNID